MGKTTEEMLAERTKRIQDACALRPIDRIPVNLNLGYMTATLGGVTRAQIDADPELAAELLERAARYYGPDMLAGVSGSPGASLVLGDRMTRWPGHGLDANASFQFVEGEYMHAEDYDHFLDDPSDFAFRTYLPRVFQGLEGLGTLPPLGYSLFGFYWTRALAWFAAPEARQALENLIRGGEAAQRAGAAAAMIAKRLASAGFPTGLLAGVLVEAPFDFMSDTLRGMRGIMLDMHRRPEKLLAAQEKASRIQIDYALAAVKRGARPVAAIPLHRGSDGFMSLEQFERFYWPQLKQLMLELIEHGITPYAYYEGTWDKRLPYLAELPRGKTIGAFDRSNMALAKEIVGDTLCMVGGFPVSLLRGGSPDEIRDYTRTLCRTAGRGGGFIMATGNLSMDDCDPERVKTWVDATREFGVY